MKLSDFLDNKVITINLKARHRDAALSEMMGILKKAGKIKDSDTIMKALLEREATGTTGIGQGMVFPHARIYGLKDPVALVALSQLGVDFNARDAEPVYLFFLFLTPTEETSLHLQILSKTLAIFKDK